MVGAREDHIFFIHLSRPYHGRLSTAVLWHPVIVTLFNAEANVQYIQYEPYTDEYKVPSLSCINMIDNDVVY